MQRLLTVISFVFLVHALQGQDPCSALNYHAFRAEVLAGTYTDLGNLGTEITVSNLDDGISDPQEVGFEFVYQCQPFTQFIFNTNGFIKLGTETSPTTNLFFANAQSTDGGIFNNADSNNVNLITVFNHDIEVVTGDPEFRVYTSGVAPNRVCTIQWKNMQEWSSDPATKQYLDMNFQLKLYETTNVIEFVYGEWGPSTNPSNYKTGACGLKGKSNSDDQLLVVVKNSAAHWDKVTFHNGNYAPNESFNFGNPPDRPKPVAGTMYRFAPTSYNDLSIREVYALGDASSYYSSPQTISANVRNSGFNTQLDIPVYLGITGSNTYSDTQYISQLAFQENTDVTFPGFIPMSNGLTSVRISVGEDDGMEDNTITTVQRINDFDLIYATIGPAASGYGFLAGVQGIYYAKYPVYGTAKVSAVNVFIFHDTSSISQTVFAAVLDQQGTLAARSENYVIQESDLGAWHTFVFGDPPLISDEAFYAGFGMTSSLVDYSPLGVQSEGPLRNDTYYTSLINGSGLTSMDPHSFTYRFMIGATLAGTEPVAGFAIGDTSFCADGMAHLTLNNYTGFIAWQQSQDGSGNWDYVSEGSGITSPNYVTIGLTASAYYRAEVSQPGFPPVYSNTLHVEVMAETPVITASGDVLLSSSATGNQWYDQNGIIPGATENIYLALSPGSYYVIVISGNCTSPPSNMIELTIVASHEANQESSLKIYPNPAYHDIVVDLPGNRGGASYEMRNASGSMVMKGILLEKTVLQTAVLPQGVYFIQVNIHGSIVIKKFVKE